MRPSTSRQQFGGALAEAVIAVTNGDSVAGTLSEAGLAGEVIPWRDVLHEGPVPDLPPAKLRLLRARYLSRRYGYRVARVEREIGERDRALSRHARDPLVLWFEADLYDQLQLIQILERLKKLGADPEDVIQIAIGEHPDRAHFAGLGQLSGDELRELVPAGRRLSRAGFDLAARAWHAFTAPNPSALVDLRHVKSVELRYLGGAIGRLLQEYPSRSDGLSLTQRRILLSMAAGARGFPDIFRACSELEARPFFGDLGFLAELRGLAAAAQPALQRSDDSYSLTTVGRKLLAGDLDWIDLNGIDRWIGGVHLSRSAVSWRYDERLETLAPAA